MTRFTSVLAITGLAFAFLGLIAVEAVNSPPTTVGGSDFPKGLVIPDSIAVDLTQNEFAFALYAVAALEVQCNVAKGAWDFIGPVGILVNDPDDFKRVFDDPTFVTAVSVDADPGLTVQAAGFRAVIPTDTSSTLFVANGTAPAPNPDADGPWLRSKAFNNTGSGAFSSVTYLQRVQTKGAIPPAASLFRDTSTALSVIKETAPASNPSIEND
ncbi:5630_t:CDS:2 [Acaulospora morrowiae]|uniref:5630_t:CDS:1 n=1 Tax=Acaulospora morrowiae TaxID=94023 RepID=A0A9N9FL93_9GLOM|nr:5630_t:CDS:2 [Acaulospora morrowiae]